MERASKKTNNNIYFACRKRAAEYNEKLLSRESAAELLGISPSSLANHELGITKNVPVDTVVMMSDLYNAPELKNHYCKYECPIGTTMPIATQQNTLAGITVRLLDALDDDAIRAMKKELLSIASDGQITEDEKPRLKKAQKALDDLAVVISELRMYGERNSDGSGAET